MTATCLFAHYDPVPTIAPQTQHLLRQIVECGYRVHVALSGHDDALLDVAKRMFPGLPITFHLRPNAGLDFGAWQDLIAKGVTEGATEILLANDSVFGPLTPLPPLVRRMRARNTDVWGMVASRAVVDHIQSWFIAFSAESFAHPAVRRIFEQPFADMTKEEIVLHGELGLGLALKAAGLRVQAAWEPKRGLAKLLATNPMHTDWRAVLKSGRVPFIKTELLRDNPSGMPDTRDWRKLIPDPAFFNPAWIDAYLASHPPRPGVRHATWRGRLVQAVAAEDRWSSLARFAAASLRTRS